MRTESKVLNLISESQPKSRVSLSLDCITELWWMVSKRNILSLPFISKQDSMLIPVDLSHCASFMFSDILLCVSPSHVLIYSFDLKDIPSHLILDICLLPPSTDTTLLHQIVFSIFDKLLLSNRFPARILLCPVQVSCGFWIMLSAGEIMANEMSKKSLSTKSLQFL